MVSGCRRCGTSSRHGENHPPLTTHFLGLARVHWIPPVEGHLATVALMDSYKTLEAWKRAHSAVLLVFQATDRARHPRAFGLFDQLKRATLSVEANIVEGYALGTVPLCRRHLRIAFGSAAEAECEARVAKELEYLPVSVVERWAERCELSTDS